jgi:hypothetical protein
MVQSKYPRTFPCIFTKTRVQVNIHGSPCIFTLNHNCIFTEFACPFIHRHLIHAVSWAVFFTCDYITSTNYTIGSLKYFLFCIGIRTQILIPPMYEKKSTEILFAVQLAHIVLYVRIAPRNRKGKKGGSKISWFCLSKIFSRNSRNGSVLLRGAHIFAVC